MKWKDLKKFANELPTEELEKDVICWREDEVVSPIMPMVLEEDHYTHTEADENGCAPMSDFNEEDKDFLKIAYKKGHPILWEEF